MKCRLNERKKLGRLDKKTMIKFIELRKQFIDVLKVLILNSGRFLWREKINFLWWTFPRNSDSF